MYSLTHARTQAHTYSRQLLLYSSPHAVSTIVYDFAMTAYAVNEGDGVVGVGLEITSPAQLFCDITVTIGTEDGTAGMIVRT